MVSGAGGSIGSELCRQIIQLQPKHIILFEQNEFSLYTIDQELQEFVGNSSNITITPILGSINDRDLVERVCKKFSVETIYHSAAYKHVPSMEGSPSEAIRVNVQGTKILADLSVENNVKEFVFVSTDKAVNPTNVMGASKRVAELVLLALSKENHNTCLTMVRFGNVLDSAGSVLPLFRNQIKEGGPITVTHSDVIRYFMSIPEAVQLVIQAGAMADGGDVFILDMGEPVNILEMAKKMIYLSGLTPIDEKNENGDIAIKITGLRPGEKLYEELLIGKDSIETEHPRIMKASEVQISDQLVEEGINEFSIACKNQDTEKIKILLSKYVSEYKPVEL